MKYIRFLNIHRERERSPISCPLPNITNNIYSMLQNITFAAKMQVNIIC